MKTPKLIISAALFLTLFCGCGDKSEFSIEPINQEYNEQFLTGKGLDARYFSTKDVVQYYQVSDFNSLSPSNVLTKLGAFVDVRYRGNMRDSIKILNVLFYRKKWMAGYDKHLYESARDNENRTLEGYSDDLVVWMTYERVKGDDKKLARTRSYFFPAKGFKPLEQRDTVVLK